MMMIISSYHEQGANANGDIHSFIHSHT